MWVSNFVEHHLLHRKKFKMLKHVGRLTLPKVGVDVTSLSSSPTELSHRAQPLTAKVHLNNTTARAPSTVPTDANHVDEQHHRLKTWRCNDVKVEAPISILCAVCETLNDGHCEQRALAPKLNAAATSGQIINENTLLQHLLLNLLACLPTSGTNTFISLTASPFQFASGKMICVTTYCARFMLPCRRTSGLALRAASTKGLRDS
jgi:hypothetical protein